MKKIYSIGIVAGLLPAVFKTIVFYAGYTEMYGGSFTNLADIFVLVVAVPLAVFIARRENDGQITFNNALKTGIGVSAIAGIIVCVFTYLYFKYMNTIVQANAIQEATKYAAEMKQNAEESRRTIEGARQFYSPFVQATSAMFGMMLAGFLVSILSAVATAFLKKEDRSGTNYLDSNS